MKIKNKFARRSRFSARKFCQLLRYFAIDLDASQIAELTGLNRNTVNRYLRAIRQRIVEYCDTQSPYSGEFEVSESFIDKRCNRGVLEKTIIFGIFKHNEKVYTEIVPQCLRAKLQEIIRGEDDFDSIIYSTYWREYHGLIDVDCGRYLRVNYVNDEFTSYNTQINGTEGFWGFAKNRLTRFRGINKSMYYLHLKECEFRFNYRDQSLYKLLLKIVLENPLF